MTTDIVQILFWAALFLIIYVYALYPVLLMLISRGAKEKRPAEEAAAYPAVSMIIAAYNEEKVIKEKIDNIGKLDYPKERFEALIGSDGSNDRTVEIAGQMALQQDNIRCFDLKRSGKASVINHLAEHSRGEILVFSDANTIYEKDAVKKLAQHFGDERTGCVCGKLVLKEKDRSNEPGESFYWRYETLLKKFESKIGCVMGGNGAIFAIRKKLFLPLPGNTVNDDFLISMGAYRDGGKMIYEDGAVAYEYTAGDLSGELKRHIRDGSGHYQVMLHLPWLFNPARPNVLFCYLSHRVLRWIIPFLLIALFFSNLYLLSYGVIYMIFGVFHFGFYLLSLIGGILHMFNIYKKPLYLPFYFVAVNAALLAGFVRWLSGSATDKWERTER